MLEVARFLESSPRGKLSRLPFSVPVPLVPDSVKPSESDKKEGGNGVPCVSTLAVSDKA
jgi:hypothetical protein